MKSPRRRVAAISWGQTSCTQAAINLIHPPCEPCLRSLSLSLKSITLILSATFLQGAASMALSSLQPPFLILAVLLISSSLIQAQIDHTSLQLMAEALEWPFTTSVNDEFSLADGHEDLERSSGVDRRSLYWMRHYYISYGALAANRIPCPARSGRSYYTHNCYRANGPVHPYSRGCSAITRCRR